MELKIGQIVYRFISGLPCYVFRFEVVAIHQYKSAKQYHVKCLSCTDHDACEMLIGYESDELRFIQMLNNNGEDDNQSHWHSWGELFYTSREEAVIARLQHIRKTKEVEIEAAEKLWSARKAELKNIDADIQAQEILLGERP